MDELENCLSAPVPRLYSAPEPPMLFSCGESSLTPRDRRELTALFSATRARLARRTLSDRQTLLLMRSGLVSGITPTSIRERYGVPIPDFVLLLPDGGRAEQRSQD